MRLTATMPTARGGPLMETAAKHFAHKVAVEQDDGSTCIAFAAGVATARVVEGGLALVIEAPDAAAAEQVRDVFESHLLRFAHREAPEPLVWSAEGE